MWSKLRHKRFTLSYTLQQTTSKEIIDVYLYLLSEQKVRFEDSFARPMTIRPPMRDADVWTGQPDYDRSLYVRIFAPEGLDQSELRCSLSYEDKMFKTPILDSMQEVGVP